MRSSTGVRRVVHVAILMVLSMMLVITTGSGNVGAIGEIEHSITLTVFQSARPDTPLEGARIVFTDAHHGTSIELFTNSQGQARYYPSVASYYTCLLYTSPSPRD